MRDWWEDGQPLDALRLSLDEYGTMVSQLAGEDPMPAGNDQRKQPRLRYWYRDVIMRLHRQGRPSIPYAVKAHNISMRGLALLSGFYVQTSTQVDLALCTLQERLVPVAGKVVRCRHLRGKVHELGIEFERPIDLREFLPVEVLPESEPTERATPRFRGRAVYLDSSADRRALVRFLGEEMGITLQAVETPAEVLQQVTDNKYDIIILKLELDDQALGLIGSLRESQCPAFIALVATPVPGEAKPNREAEFVQKGCNCVMSGPLTQPRLAELLAGVLTRETEAQTSDPPLVSSLWTQVKMRPLILNYVGRLGEQFRQLQTLVAGAERQALLTACQEWRDSAESFGFAPLSTALQALEAMVAQEAPVPELTAKVDELGKLCQAAGRVMKT